MHMIGRSLTRVRNKEIILPFPSCNGTYWYIDVEICIYSCMQIYTCIGYNVITRATSDVHPKISAGLRCQCPKSVEATFLVRGETAASQHSCQAARPIFGDIERGRWTLRGLFCFTVRGAHGLKEIMVHQDGCVNEKSAGGRELA